MEECPEREVAFMIIPFPRKSLYRDLMSLKTQQLMVCRCKHQSVFISRIFKTFTIWSSKLHIP